MSVESDFGQWGAILLAPGADAWWWFTWGLDSNHWVWMDAEPDNWPASVWIMEQWAERDANNTLKHWCHFRNNGNTPVSFRPKMVVIPNR